MFTIYVYVQDMCTPLYAASDKGFTDVVKSLIAADANVNCICKVSGHIISCIIIALATTLIHIAMWYSYVYH